MRVFLGAASALAAALLFPLAVGQTPAPLEEREGKAHEILPYNYSAHLLELEARDYYLAFMHRGAGYSSWVVKHEGRQIAQSGLYPRDGVALLEFAKKGTYRIEFTGQGDFAVLYPELFRHDKRSRDEVNITASDAVGYVVARRSQAGANLCVDTGAPVTIEVYSGQFALAERQESVQRFRRSYEETWYEPILVIVNPSAPTWLRAAVAVGSCEPEDSPSPAGTGSERAPGLPGPSLGAVLALLGLFLLTGAASRAKTRQKL